MKLLFEATKKAVKRQMLIAGIMIISFIIGWIVAVNFSGIFETGYKYAWAEIYSAARDADKRGELILRIHGIDLLYVWKAESLKAPVRIIENGDIAGADVRKEK